MKKKTVSIYKYFSKDDKLRLQQLKDALEEQKLIKEQIKKQKDEKKD